MKNILYILIFIVGMTSCSSDSSDVLSMGEMEDILYDIYLSQNIEDEENRDRKMYNEITNREAIYRKYDITQAEWDSSYNYYCRHADKLHTIYKNLSERIRAEVIELGGGERDRCPARSSTPPVCGQTSIDYQAHAVRYGGHPLLQRLRQSPKRSPRRR